MRFHTRKIIEKSLFDLNSSGIEWILLRNTDDELPDSLEVRKDIDILVKIQGNKGTRYLILRIKVMSPEPFAKLNNEFRPKRFAHL